ncbi:hypothetical protein [Marinobacterium litorale]|uniref:hypothetical protein n=1 Tax=Marinobacterium litorale TaxID=404770 RepID=UPI0003F9E984|nr:hypothetical protein [Marinobacterium litorale]
MDNNVQNQLIKENLTKVSLAVNTLQALGLTVTSFSAVDGRPLVLINPGRGCQQLKSGYTKNAVRNGRRIIERVAFVSECQVRWEEIQ